MDLAACFADLAAAAAAVRRVTLAFKFIATTKNTHQRNTVGHLRVALLGVTGDRRVAERVVEERGNRAAALRDLQLAAKQRGQGASLRG